MRIIAFNELRARLAATLRGVEVGREPVVISRRGKPAAVLLSYKQYRQLEKEPREPLGDWLRRWRAEYEASGCLAADEGDDPFAGLRDPDPDGPSSPSRTDSTFRSAGDQWSADGGGGTGLLPALVTADGAVASLTEMETR